MHDGDSNYIKPPLVFLKQIYADRRFDSNVAASGMSIGRRVYIYIDPIWQSTYAPDCYRTYRF